MKHLRLVVWAVCAGLIAGCESTDMAGNSNAAEQRALARQRAAQAEAAEHTPKDEAQQNLWQAQHDVVNRDGNPMARY
jgi:hypothetical protein